MTECLNLILKVPHRIERRAKRKAVDAQMEAFLSTLLKHTHKRQKHTKKRVLLPSFSFPPFSRQPNIPVKHTYIQNVMKKLMSLGRNLINTKAIKLISTSFDKIKRPMKLKIQCRGNEREIAYFDNERWESNFAHTKSFVEKENGLIAWVCTWWVLCVDERERGGGYL